MQNEREKSNVLRIFIVETTDAMTTDVILEKNGMFHDTLKRSRSKG